MVVVRFWVGGRSNLRQGWDLCPPLLVKSLIWLF
jgi:hypothetical protein